ncbi:thioredoxin family protein [Ohtaekwangia kribbensis]|jgi:thioredoxin-related protein|uniref:Thioredoxin family protein n=1 Tax=Ohtaekwangia kribbensis TaxID=688913 RepID=A0ABW3K6H1_9BACT
MKLLLVYILLITMPAVEWLGNFNTAKDLATKDHKYILINFSGSDWCAPCIKMKKEVFENEAFVNLAEKKLVLVRADFPRSKKNQLPGEQVKHNEALAEKYNPSGKFPFTVLVDSNGNVIKTWDGYVFGSYEKFIENLNNAIPQP